MNFRYPIDAVVFTQGFGDNPDYYKQFGQLGHNGLDISCPIGTPVYASEAGGVFYEGQGAGSPLMGAIAGICVILDHNTVMTGYAHLSSTIINAGQEVTKGQLIGYSGSTGTSTGGHVHFEFIGKPVNISNGYYGRVNPATYLQGENGMITDRPQLDRLYDGVLGDGITKRSRGVGEGEDVYLGKDSGFVFDDLYKSQERANRIAATNAKFADLKTQLATANKEITRLKALPTSTVASDIALAKDTNAKVGTMQVVVASIQATLNRVLK